MAVTQYTGARYVPLFAEPAEWANTYAYEPLTIVVHEGNSYTSKQAVPKGVDISNEKYWALTGNYNAQVEQYRKEVKQYGDKIDANTAAISAETTRAESVETTLTEKIEKEIEDREYQDNVLTSAITAEETRATGVESELDSKISAESTARVDADTALDNRVAVNTNNLNAEITRAKAVEATKQGVRTIALFTDSFGGGIYPDSSSSTGYSKSKYGWATYLVNNAPANTKIYWGSNTVETGNSGFSSSRPWETTAKNMASDGAIPDPTSVTEIWCLGGTNEVTSSLDAAIKSFCNTCKTLYPNATIYIGCIGSGINSTLNAVSKYYQKCTDYGAVYVDCTLNLMCRKGFVSSDGTHLTVDGYRHYCQTVYDIIIGHKEAYLNSWITTLSSSQFNSGVAMADTSHGFRFHFFSTNEGGYLYMQETQTSKAPYIQLSGDSLSLSVNELFNNVFKTDGPTSYVQSVWQCVNCRIHLSDGTSVPAVGYLYYNPATDVIGIQGVTGLVNYSSSEAITRLDIWIDGSRVDFGNNREFASAS